jgi:hypothetical protein
MGYHAILSPSSAARWMMCPGSVKLSEGLPDSGSKYADEGTAAHFVAADCLQNDTTPDVHFGRFVHVSEEATCWVATAGDDTYEVDLDMEVHVRAYVAAVREMAKGGVLLVEQALPISSWTGEDGATGSADAVVVTPDGELQVHDLKYGMGVPVGAKHNKQLMLYALGAVEEFSVSYDFDRVRLVIHQPRAGGMSDWVLTVAELEAFGMEVVAAANKVKMAGLTGDLNQYLNPSEKGCQWCRAKAECPALYAAVSQAVGNDFESLDTPEAVDAALPTDPVTLSEKMAVVGLVEHWCKAIRARVEGELFAAVHVPGWKLVQGKRGNRRWSDPVEAERLMKERFRLKVEEMYDLKLISPTTAEKLAKAGTVGPRQWKLVSDLITQDDGKPSVAPESDKRPALVVTPTADDFEDLGEDLV